MTSPQQNKTVLIVLAITVVLFIAGRLIGGTLFNNNWSFIHWSYQPVWYTILWLVALVAGVSLVWRYRESLGLFFAKKKWAIAGMAAILVLTTIAGFDSFLYGGGNVRVGQIAQQEVIIYRWFELGSVLFAGALFKFYSVFGLAGNTAGVLAWRSLAFLATAFSLVAAAKLAVEMTGERVNRLFIFLILFFGGQTLMYFNFVGIEPVVVPVSLWFALYVYRAGEEGSRISLVWMWLIAAFGVFMHFSMIFLIPAALFITIASLSEKSSTRWLAFLVGLAGYIGLIVLVYHWGSTSLEFSKYVLFLKGKLPESDYGLFDGRHIGDFVQFFILALPLILVMKGLAVMSPKHMTGSRAAMAGWLMALGGLTVVFILDPTNNIVLDTPRFMAYLVPLSFLFAVLAAKASSGDTKPAPWLAAVAIVAVMLPLSYLPVYRSIAQSDGYVTSYLEQHDSMYRRAIIAFRDAYFYKKQLDPANAWEWKLPYKSPDYLNLRGCRDLALTGKYDDAIMVLNRMITANPRWSEPRLLLASTQIAINNFQAAWPQIDTCLMLNPYDKSTLIQEYAYYRSRGEVAKALNGVEKALKLYPRDSEIRTDQMLLNFRIGNVGLADSLAHSLMVADTSLPFPFLVRALIEDQAGHTDTAVMLYQKFVDMAPDEPEAAVVRHRLDSLQTPIGTE